MASLQQELPLQTALLHAGAPSSVRLDPALLTAQNISKHVNGFTALHAAALANNPGAIATLMAAAPELANVALKRGFNHQPAECQLVQVLQPCTAAQELQRGKVEVGLTEEPRRWRLPWHAIMPRRRQRCWPLVPAPSSACGVTGPCSRAGAF
ncbi:hypothetical protein ABPG75_000993 [Micractinium tetrahymenae]